ncbi:hypothetical protein Q3G72_008732 [Acer saccharum]|nr:hypothetical protein Q3G72_008732 [Acer saccharum]
MKYVRPYTLLKEFQKKTKELAKRQSLGGASLLGFTVTGDYVSIGYFMPKSGIDSEYRGIFSMKEHDIDDIAIEFRDLYLADVRQNPQDPAPPFVEMWVGKFIMQEYFDLYLKDHYPLDEDEDDED